MNRKALNFEVSKIEREEPFIMHSRRDGTEMARCTIVSVDDAIRLK